MAMLRKIAPLVAVAVLKGWIMMYEISHRINMDSDPQLAAKILQRYAFHQNLNWHDYRALSIHQLVDIVVRNKLTRFTLMIHIQAQS